MVLIIDGFNHSRFQPGSQTGFYESYFQRANHPTRPLAFWIRYTIFAPRQRPDAALGEIWAIWFDGENRRHVVAKIEVPPGQYAFSRDGFDARVGSALLTPGRMTGAAESRGHRIAWDLSFSGAEQPLFLMPPNRYSANFPKAKSLVALPLARFQGVLTVDGTRIDVDDWIGSQNHNWGEKHTDRYAWGQVAGFDNAPDSFLEVATGQLKIGPLWTPRFTPLVLRHENREYALRSIRQALRAHGRFGYFEWSFRSATREVAIEGTVTAPRDAFVGLRYYNPPGGDKYCLNSKIASCSVKLTRPDAPPVTLETRHRAAFEILTDDLDHGVEIRT